MTTTQTKIQKTSKYIYIGLMIGKVSAIAGTVLLAFALTCGLVGRPDVQSWFVGMESYPDPQKAAIMIPVMLGLMVAAFAVTVAICDQLGRVFRDIREEGTPFSAKHAVRIKRVAWLGLALPVLSGTIGNVEKAILSGDGMIMIHIDMMMVVFMGIIYCLAYIFDYGCKLQQESDETL